MEPDAPLIFYSQRPPKSVPNHGSNARPNSTPQGGPISVLISNVYLHYVLDLWFEKVVKVRLKGRSKLIRYLDDFVIIFENLEDARAVEEVLRLRLNKFDLELEPTKTRLINFKRPRKQGARVIREGERAFSFLGLTLYWGLSVKGFPVLRFKTEKKRLARSMAKIKAQLQKMRHNSLESQSKQLNSYLRGHYQYFGLSSNSDSLVRLYRFVYKSWRKTLSSRSQKSYVNWIKYAKILSYYPILRPKIQVSFSDLRAMAVL